VYSRPERTGGRDRAVDSVVALCSTWLNRNNFTTQFLHMLNTLRMAFHVPYGVPSTDEKEC